MPILINASILGGTDLAEAARELVDFSRRGNVSLRAEFNGYWLIVHPTDNAADAVQRYETSLGPVSKVERSTEYDEGVDDLLRDLATLSEDSPDQLFAAQLAARARAIVNRREWLKNR